MSAAGLLPAALVMEYGLPMVVRAPARWGGAGEGGEVGGAECGSGVDAEVSGLRGCLCCDCYRRGDFDFDGGVSAGDGAGAVRGGAGVLCYESLIAQSSALGRV